MADTKATYQDQKQGKNAPNDAARDIPKRTEPERVAPKKEPTDEQIDQSLKAIRELVQNLRNRGDQDVNKVLDNMNRHLEVIDPQEEAA